VLRAIVFDFDGVIANSEPLHFRAYRDVLHDQGVDLTERDYYSRYLGYDDVGAFTAIAADRGVSWTPREIVRLVIVKAERMEALERDESVLFPGAREAIHDAAAIMPIAIASGALSAEIRRVLDAAALTSHFTTIVAAEDTVASKPAPDPYLLAVARLAQAHGPLVASECVALEDSRWGIESARAAGLRTVGVAQTYDATELATAEFVIPNLQALDLEELRRFFNRG